PARPPRRDRPRQPRQDRQESRPRAELRESPQRNADSENANSKRAPELPPTKQIQPTNGEAGVAEEGFRTSPPAGTLCAESGNTAEPESASSAPRSDGVKPRRRRERDPRREWETQEALRRPIEALEGVGPKMAEKFAVLGISSIEDLLYYFPRRYDDYTQL